MSGWSAPTITVVGSANMDVVVPVSRLPRPGETVIGGDHFRAPGGKGANQAVACARLGATTRFIGCVGDDDPGRALLGALSDDHVDTTHVAVLPGSPSGLALIVVDSGGENTIVVSPGANARLGAQQLHPAAFTGSAAVLLQLEVPLEVVMAAAEVAEGLVVLNPAPAIILPPVLLERTDVLVPNRGELALLAGADAEPTELDEVVELARRIDGPSSVVVTLGQDGAVVVERGAVSSVPAHAVEAVDATAAGDSFCGALVVALSEGASLEAATRWAATAAAITVTRRGAQPSLPTREQVEAAVAGQEVRP